MSSIRFSYSPLTAGRHEVGLAGDFSAWQILPMEDFGGLYLLALDLPQGVYRYKLIVDGNWICDGSNPVKEPDPFGGVNSVLHIEDVQSSLSWSDAIILAKNKRADDHVKLYRYSEIELELRFSWYCDLADRVLLHLGDNVHQLQRIGKTTLFDVYYIVVADILSAKDASLSRSHSGSLSRSHSGLIDCQTISISNGLKDSCDSLPPGPTHESLSPNKIEVSLKQSTATMTPAQSVSFFYYIEIIYQNQHRYLSANGWQDTSDGIDPILVDLSEYSIFSIPPWVGKGIIYQIYPDRFYNGDLTNDPDFSEWYYADCKTPPPEGEFLAPEQEYFHLVKDWYNISGLKQSPYLPEGKPDWWSFYGGDIAGVKTKLDYLKDLSIDIIYFNPLWQAKSNHKYDSADYHSIDTHFATTAEMIEFVKLAHDNGIKIILDVAFNHTGETFWAFRDCVEKGQKSPYWNWYDWMKWPLPKPLPPDFKPKEYYQCWWGIKDMPDLNFDLSRHHPEENPIRNIKEARPNAALLDYLISTVRWWLLDIGIDGFRLDVPDEVPYWFWELFRAEVKKAKPDAWIVGEIWHDAVNWVSPSYFDSVMNYAFFKNPVLEFFIFGLISEQEFIDKIETGLALYPYKALQAMMNLLGSHDTLRIFELCKGNLKGLQLAILFQMCFIGTPHIYYGDEIAMGGGKDPDNRRPFNWDWESDAVACELRSFYKELISIRKSHPAFVEGSFAFCPSIDGLLVFCRKLNAQKLCVYINYSSEALPLTLPPNAVMLFGKSGNDLSPHSAIIYTISE